MFGIQSWRVIYQTGFMAVAASIALGTLAMVRLFSSYAIPPFSSGSITAAWPAVDSDAFSFDASVFKRITADPGNTAPENAIKRFRLAGTFFAIGLNQQTRKAILDDLRKKEQLLVTEGDLIENDTRVISILADRVILRKGSEDEQIMLCFTSNGQPAGQKTAVPDATKGKLEVQNRFGKRVGDKRWVLTRAELLNYYQEALNNTDRLAKIYESLKPIYEGQKIAGYTLDIEGEGDMFTAFGLQQGDIIRQVNSMPMTSQTRAEYFISEFVKNRVNGFVLEIERAGQKERLIYMVR